MWDLYPAYKKAFYFQRNYVPTMRGYHDISIKYADGRQYTHFGSSSLHEHIK